MCWSLESALASTTTPHKVRRWRLQHLAAKQLLCMLPLLSFSVCWLPWRLLAAFAALLVPPVHLLSAWVEDRAWTAHMNQGWSSGGAAAAMDHLVTTFGPDK